MATKKITFDPEAGAAHAANFTMLGGANFEGNFEVDFGNHDAVRSNLTLNIPFSDIVRRNNFALSCFLCLVTIFEIFSKHNSSSLELLSISSVIFGLKILSPLYCQ